MAVLLVGLSVAAIMMSAAMPVWKQSMQREREEEMLFRAKQYARAVVLFQRKYANAFPPNLEVLIDQKFLRKKFKDPITGEDFELLRQGSQAAALPGRIARQPSGQQPSRQPQSQPAAQPRPGTSGSFVGQQFGGGGIIGVTSKSKAESIRLYKGRNHYNEWQVLYSDVAVGQAAPGQPGAKPGMPGRPGQPGPGMKPGMPGTGPMPFPPFGPGGQRPQQPPGPRRP